MDVPVEALVQEALEFSVVVGVAVVFRGVASDYSYYLDDRTGNYEIPVVLGGYIHSRPL